MQNPFAKGPHNAENLRSRKIIAKSTCDQRRSSFLKKKTSISKSLQVPLDTSGQLQQMHKHLCRQNNVETESRIKLSTILALAVAKHI
jgi:hypothetical protein